MDTTVGALIEQLSKYDSSMQVRIVDITNDSGESGVYEIKDIEHTELSKIDDDSVTIDAVILSFELYPQS